jgi:hypothetical protein
MPVALRERDHWQERHGGEAGQAVALAASVGSIAIQAEHAASKETRYRSVMI